MNEPPRILRVATWTLALLTVGVLGGLILGGQRQLGPVACGLFTLLALACQRQATLKSFAFTCWVFAFVAAAMVWPQAFGQWRGYDLKNLIVPLVQLIMFGMGTKLSTQDFLRVLVMPRPVLIGVALHFGVMPLTGYSLARLFGFPAEIAAGVVLIGSVSSGVASNVIVYLSGGNVALAVTVTACSTLVSPLMTPFLMKTLAGRLVPIDFLAMLLEILSMVIVPVIAGLVANHILYGAGKRFASAKSLAAVAVGAFALAVAAGLTPAEPLGPLASLSRGAGLGLALIGVVALTKLIVAVWLRGPQNWMDRALPVISMAGICFIIAIIAARSRDRLLGVGFALIFAAMLHNAIGYLLGYWLSRLAGLEETACRTIAVEVGMQNGGMATGLAMGVLKSADAALAPAIFGTWMNISGSVLASWWRRRPVVPVAPTTQNRLPNATVAAANEPNRQE